MKNTHLFVVCALASFIPWGWVVKPLGTEAQLIGLAVQLIGLSVLLFKREYIFG